MPDFQLSRGERNALVSYILSLRYLERAQMLPDDFLLYLAVAMGVWQLLHFSLLRINLPRQGEP